MRLPSTSAESIPAKSCVSALSPPSCMLNNRLSASRMVTKYRRSFEAKQTRHPRKSSGRQQTRGWEVWVRKRPTAKRLWVSSHLPPHSHSRTRFGVACRMPKVFGYIHQLPFPLLAHEQPLPLLSSQLGEPALSPLRGRQVLAEARKHGKHEQGKGQNVRG